MCSTSQEIIKRNKLAFSAKVMTISQTHPKLIVILMLLFHQSPFNQEKWKVTDNATLPTLPLSFSTQAGAR